MKMQINLLQQNMDKMVKYRLKNQRWIQPIINGRYCRPVAQPYSQYLPELFQNLIYDPLVNTNFTQLNFLPCGSVKCIPNPDLLLPQLLPAHLSVILIRCLH